MGNGFGGKRIGVVGAGIMGRLLIQGLLQHEVAPGQIWAAVRTEKSRLDAAAALGLPVHTAYLDELAHTDLLLLCVKPKAVRGVCQAIREAGTLPDEALVVSIAAGVSIAEIERELGGPNPVVRAMPNTPCRVRTGMTVICRGTHTGEEHVLLARAVFQAVGRCLELDEGHMDAVTGLSASGPAFIYLIIEALADTAAPGRPAGRGDHAGRLHDQRAADAGGREDPVGARPRGRGGHADRRAAEQIGRRGPGVDLRASAAVEARVPAAPARAFPRRGSIV